MVVVRAVPGRLWRVAVTRDEHPVDGALSRALRAQGFEPVPCPVVCERPPENPHALADAARRLDQFDWVVLASARAVTALAAARKGQWPRGVRTAAVGPRTAAALVALDAEPRPLSPDVAGAGPLLALLLRTVCWPGLRVLVPTVPGGLRTVIDGLRAAGAQVEEVDAYRTVAISAASIAARWAQAAVDAAVIASPSAATALIDAVGADSLGALRSLLAIGPTTAAALHRHGLRPLVAPAADFQAVAASLAAAKAADQREGHEASR